MDLVQKCLSTGVDDLNDIKVDVLPIVNEEMAFKVFNEVSITCGLDKIREIDPRTLVATGRLKRLW